MNKLYLTLYLAKFKLETESARSYLGYFWWFLDPMLNASIYYLLFDVILKKGGENFIYFLFIGIILWRWMDNTISKGLNSILIQTNLLKKLYVSKDILVFSEMLMVLSKFVVVFTVVYRVYFLKFGFHHSHAYLLPIMLCHYTFAVGMGMLLASIAPMAPDIRLVYSHAMRLLFYPSGILFSLSKLPERLQKYVALNPLVGLFESYRNILMYHQEVKWGGALILLIIGLVAGGVGQFVLKKYDRRYAKFLN